MYAFIIFRSIRVNCFRRGGSLVDSVPLGRIPLRNLGQVLHAQEVIVRWSGSLAGSVPLGGEFHLGSKCQAWWLIGRFSAFRGEFQLGTLGRPFTRRK